MIDICQCPSCGVEMKLDKSAKRLQIKCPKCAYKGLPADFKKVTTVETLYCPACNAPYNYRADKPLPKNITCPKCGSTNGTTKYTEAPQAPCKPDINPDDIPTDTSLGNDLGKLYRPATLRFESDEGGWAGTLRDFTLMRGGNTLGRRSPASSGSIQFPTTDAYMSKNHAAIEVVMMHDSTFEHRLSDNRSVNGTFHNGTRLDPDEVAVLMPGDTLRLGRTTFRFVIEQTKNEE